MSTSYRDLPPLEQGGEIARRGFAFQDHIAAAFCIDMLSDDNLLEVWCEIHDDITLVWKDDQGESFEFVQVKSNQFNQLWSVSRLCQQDKNQQHKNQQDKNKKSILEKSLDNDRGKESCKFRIVTTLDINKELEILKSPFTGKSRINGSEKLNELCKLVQKKIKNYTSPNGNNIQFWLERTFWDVKHSEESVENNNLLKLIKFGSDNGEFLGPDQWREVYKQKLLTKLKETAERKLKENSQEKRIRKDDFKSLVKEAIENVNQSGKSATGTKLRRKMQSADLSSELIEMALEQRRLYRSKKLDTPYLELSNIDTLEGEVRANLIENLSQLDSGNISDSGVDFHNNCLKTLRKIHNSLSVDQPIELAVLQGFMYYMTDRCAFRFRRAGT